MSHALLLPELQLLLAEDLSCVHAATPEGTLEACVGDLGLSRTLPVQARMSPGPAADLYALSELACCCLDGPVGHSLLILQHARCFNGA